MRAVTVQSLDGPDGLRVGEIPDPESDGTGVLIAVEAAGLTFPDLLASHGRYQLKPPLPFVPASQLAGTVLAAPSASELTVGQRVCAFSMFGGLAEKAVVSAEHVFPLPEPLDMEAGAALLLNHLTAEFVLDRRGRLTEGETVLVHGAAGGVGLATVALAAARGARVLAVVSTPEKADAAREAGAHEAVEVEGFRERARELTGGRGVDVVVDPVGGDRFTDSLRSLGEGGRLVVVGFTGGEIPTVKVNRLLLNNTEVIGAAWGEYALRRPGFIREQWAALEPLLAAGQLRPRVGAMLPLDEAAEGLRILERRGAIGNIVVRIT